MHFPVLSIRQKKGAFLNGAIWRAFSSRGCLNTKITGSFMLRTHNHLGYCIDLNIKKNEYGLILINILRIFH